MRRRPRRGAARLRLVGMLAAAALVTARVWVLAPVYCVLRTKAPPTVVSSPPPSRWRIVDGHRRIWFLDELEPGSVIEGADLRGADWHDYQGLDDSFAKFVRCNFRGANLSGADLKKIEFCYCNFASADLSHASLGWGDWRTNALRGATLKDADYYIETKWPRGFNP